MNWFGDWSTEALYQVGKEFTSKMDLEKPNYIVPDYMPVVYDKLPQPPSHREAIVNSCVFVHQTLHQVDSAFHFDTGVLCSYRTILEEDIAFVFCGGNFKTY